MTIIRVVVTFIRKKRYSGTSMPLVRKIKNQVLFAKEVNVSGPALNSKIFQQLKSNVYLR